MCFDTVLWQGKIFSIFRCTAKEKKIGNLSLEAVTKSAFTPFMDLITLLAFQEVI